MTVLLEARNEALRRVGEIDDFTSLELTPRFNRTSTWTLTCSASSPAATLLTETGGIIATRDDFVLSGPVVTVRRALDGNTETLTFTGVDDNTWLEGRLALPVPAGPPYTAAAYDVLDGPAETVLRSYVGRNLGPGATLGRRLAGLTLPADLGRGDYVKETARFEPLLQVLQRVALAGGDLGFRILQVGTGLQFTVYEPQDRTTTAKFSRELGNLRAYDYSRSRPAGNYVYVAGGGEGTDRVFAEGGDQASIDRWQRLELFRDRRDTSDPVVLEQQLLQSLVENTDQTSLSITPVDTEAVRFGRDYNLGDRVTVVVDGQPIQDVVRELKITVNKEGEVITPVIGTPGAANPRVPAFFDSLRRAVTRLTNLERR